MNNNPSKFVKIIRQKLIPLPLQKIEIKEEVKVVKEEVINGGSKYVAIDNANMELRIQHTIRNLMELDADELAYIEDMNCKNMFIIVVLLNKVVATLVENIMAMDC